MATKINSLIPRPHRRAIWEHLFKAGTLVVKKDPKAPRHPDIKIREEACIPNLHVMLAMRSLKSKNYVSEVYNWRYFYYVLNNEGVEYLREKLQLPSGVDPNTHQNPVARDRGVRRDDGENWGGRRMGGMRGAFGARRNVEQE